MRIDVEYPDPRTTYHAIRDSIVANLLDGNVSGRVTLDAGYLAGAAADYAMYALGFELDDDGEWEGDK